VSVSFPGLTFESESDLTLVVLEPDIAELTIAPLSFDWPNALKNGSAMSSAKHPLEPLVDGLLPFFPTSTPKHSKERTVFLFSLPRGT
jgi:hypothetical protein